MVSLTGDEEELVEALASCLALAISGADDVDYSDLNKTKTQKLLYLAIDEFDLPITYCWYLAGSLVESDSVNPGSVESAFDTLPTPDSPSLSEDPDDPDEATDFADGSWTRTQSPPPEPPDVNSEMAREFETAMSDEDRLRTPDDRDRTSNDRASEPDEEEVDTSIKVSDHGSTPNPDDIDSPEGMEFHAHDIVEFLQTRLANYPLWSTDEFLLHFYHHHAPSQYRQLYESSLHIRSELRSITQQVRNVTHNDGGLEGIEQKVERVSDHITDFHLDLYEHDDLRETVRGVVSATDVIEDALMMIKQLAENEIHQGHVDALEELQTFFYSGVWKYPALKIAAQTATGPSADRIERTRNRQFNSFEEELVEFEKDVVAHLATVGLVPSAEDYLEPKSDDVGTAITDLFTAYTSQSESE